ncbi:MAG: Gfo/Idh/MocA family oxidoreductase, partial [Propionibacteriaceae bacterium]|nr:Gfo/Idh/MocA family oxidoreductase [Propionibacteriaceae bacterium]
MSSKKQIGVGVVSLGWMGRLHARSYRSVSERFPELGVAARLVAAADPIDEARRAAVEDLGFERAFSDYHELLADPQVEAVSICSPNYLHQEIALAAIEAGKPFWIEKPMGVNADQSRTIAQAAARAGLVTAVGFNYRHVPAIEYLRTLVRSGELGRITNVRVWFIADYNASPKGPLTWRASREKAGAGVVPDLMSHGADLAQYIVGRIASVTATT